MAVTAIWNIKGRIGSAIEYAKNPDKTIKPADLKNSHLTEEEQESLINVIEYAAQEQKISTGGAIMRFITGIGCDPNDAVFEMMEVKKQYGKLGGNTAYHAYQSFKIGEVTPETAHEIGRKLAQEIWGDRFQVVVATHLDKEHIHTHFIINAVSFLDGGKYNDCTSSYMKIRNVSDRLCREYGLSVIEKPAPGKTKHYAEWRAEKENKPTWRGIIKADVDEAIKGSMTDTQFFNALRLKGYEIKFGKDISVRPPGKERFLRLARNFGEDYTLQSINSRIYAQQRAVRPKSQGNPRRCRNKRTLVIRRRRSIGGLMGLYLHYQYLLGIFPKNRKSPRRNSFSLKADLIKLDTISAETKLLFKYKIETSEQLTKFIAEKESSIDEFVKMREGLRSVLIKQKDPETKESIKSEITGLTMDLKELRKEVRLADDIADRSGMIREQIKTKPIVEKQIKEAEKDERFR